MLTTPDQDPIRSNHADWCAPADALGLAPDVLGARLAEAAAYAVLQRMAPVLRHDMVGAIQPVSILMALLQKRMQMPEPDVQAIAKNLASVSAAAKEVAASCVNAMGWVASNDNPLVNLRTSVDEAAQLMAMELSAAGLKVSNHIFDDSAVVPQSFFRSLLMGALLAFCDQHPIEGSLEVTLDTGLEATGQPVLFTNSTHSTHSTLLTLRTVPSSTDKTLVPADTIRKSRCIDWSDIQALANYLDVTMARGDGWLTLDFAGSRR